ncbi:MAG: DUF3098 domain-containing protein, partial [Paludibacteraceae bacterium]|nr:DUF3098 domain-containing protein [Paludibacteraceae bacterium]
QQHRVSALPRQTEVGAGHVALHAAHAVQEHQLVEPCTTEFNPDVFSFRRITLAPIICMLGFFGMIVAIMIKKK